MVRVWIFAFLSSILSGTLLFNVQTNQEAAKGKTGSQLYDINCAACHGNDKMGKEPAFPSLLNLSQRMTHDEIMEVLNNGRNAMPSFSYLLSEEKMAIIDFLAGKNGFSSNVTDISEEKRGEYLFVAQCSSCHEIESAEREYSDSKSWRMGKKPTDLGGVNRRLSMSEFTGVLNLGPCYMPSFSEMPDEHKQAIYSYLSSFKELKQTQLRKCGCKW